MDRHVVTLLAMTTRRWRFALAIGVCHCEPGWAGAAIQLGIQMDRRVVTLLAMTSMDRRVAALLAMTMREGRAVRGIGGCHREPGSAGVAIQLGIQMDRHVVTLLAMTSVDRHVASLLSMTNGRHDSARAAEVDCGFAAALADDFAVAFE